MNDILKPFVRLGLLAMIVLLFSIILAGCCMTGELIQSTSTIDLGDAKQVETTLSMLSGKLKVAGKNQSPLLVSQFSYNLEKWYPDINYQVDNGNGELSIIQKQKGKTFFNETQNEWTIFLNQEIPLSLDIILGNGENRLDLAQLNLKKLDTVIGNGETIIDLDGQDSLELFVNIIGGIGHTTINIPKKKGIRILIKGGLNKISMHGFDQIGNFYYNPIFDISQEKIFITLVSGFGIIDVNLN